MEREQRNTYTGERRRCVALPLGGVGAGHVSICGDGSLRQWQIFNNVNHVGYLPNSFFAIRTVGERDWATGTQRSAMTSRLLIAGALDDEGFQPAPMVTDDFIPPELKRLKAELPPMQSSIFIGEYPYGRVQFLDEALPLKVTLTAYTPLLPLNSRDSGLPAAIFSFSLHNPGEAAVDFALLGSLQNAVGWDGCSVIHSNCGHDFRGNYNVPVRLGQLSAVHMQTQGQPAEAAGWGDMTLAVLDREATLKAQWENLADLWADFCDDGRLTEASRLAPSPPGQTVNGAVATRGQLKPGEEKTLTFLLTWYFPNRYVSWSQSGFGIPDDGSKLFIGNMYSNWFGSSLEVAQYVVREKERLEAETEEFAQHFYDATLPYPLLDAAGSQICEVRSPTTMWLKDGSFHGFEGCCVPSREGSEGGCCGCCPLNCTHVWNYAMTCARLWPDLEQTVRRTDLKVQMTPEGAVRMRTVLPLWAPRWDQAENQSNIACDGHWGTILKVCREYRSTGDREFLDEMWPLVKKAVDHGIKQWDSDPDGVLDGPQWNTYDLFFYGANTYCSGLYLAALLAAAEMAEIMGETDLAQAWRELSAKGTAWIEKELWNGEYYEQKYDEAEHTERQYGKGCLSDQLIGQWWADHLDLGYIFDPEHVRTALASILKYNFREHFRDFVQQPRIYAQGEEKGLLGATWPYGGRQEVPMLYCDETWPGIEYQVASHMIREGMLDEALQIVGAARARYDGARRNPFNEIECGDHYIRSTSSWKLFENALGYQYNAGKQDFAFAPRFNADDFQAPFFAAHGWGQFRQKRESGQQTNSLKCLSGTLDLATVKLTLSEALDSIQAQITLAGREVPAQVEIEADQVVLTLAEAVSVEAGETLEIALRG